MTSGSPVPPLLEPVARLAEPLYRTELARRNRRFDRGVGVLRPAVPVISVGNLSVGGTGKTPVVARIARSLVSMGHRPGIVLRGYRAKPGELSDEHAEYLDQLPDVPVEANPNRPAGIERLVRDSSIDCAVLDDGFQHRACARDLDIVLIDATRDPFEDRCLPAGWLREPVTALSRAHAVVITRSDLARAGVVDRLREKIQGIAPSARLLEATHTWSGILNAQSGQTPPTDSLKDRRVIVVCGIGNPDAFIKQARGCAMVVDTLVCRDHHHWSEKDISAIAGLLERTSAEALLVTHKDWVKLRRLLPGAVVAGRPVLYPSLGISIVREEVNFENLLRDAVSVNNRTASPANDEPMVGEAAHKPPSEIAR